MSWYLTLSIENGVVDTISLAYGHTLEAAVLEEIFPREHWVMENPEAGKNPPEFDFIGNAKAARKVVEDYLNKKKGYLGDPSHAPKACWEEEFLKTYDIGERLQKLGLRPRVSIA